MIYDYRLIKFYGNAAYMQLTQGFWAVLDAEDAYLVCGRDWHARKCSGPVYAVANGHPDENGKRGQIQMHRLIMGAPKGILVDHRDGNGLNNRRSNLRLATKAENARNKPAHRNNRSGLKGVHWSQVNRRWIALITHDGQKHHLGTFGTKEEASAAYEAAAIRLHGEFAYGAENGVQWSEPKAKQQQQENAA